jgi:hypothetical protein
MDGHSQQKRQGKAAQASAMLLSLLFSVWLAVGGIAGGAGPTNPEFQRAAPTKAVMVQAGAPKQAQQPRQPDSLPLPLSPATIVRGTPQTYPSGANGPQSALPLPSAGTAPYQARAPPAR